jgi:hypothetical protein
MVRSSANAIAPPQTKREDVFTPGKPTAFDERDEDESP